MKLPGLLILYFTLVILAGCDKPGQDHAEDSASRDHHDSIDAAQARKTDHDDHDDHGGHDDHGHAHGDESTVVITHFTDQTELFVEFPPFIVGMESTFAAHLTRLDSYKAIASGTVTVTLSGGGAADEVFTIDVPSIPGIFRPVVIPQHAVKRKVSLHLLGEGLDIVHELGEHQVYSIRQAALQGLPDSEEPEDAISYLKEQQWQVAFAVSQARQTELRDSFRATGNLRPRADGEVYLSSTTAGHLHAKDQFPYAGMRVERGQVLATIVPRLGAGGDLATLKAARDKARSEFKLAKHERERLERLWKEKAIAEHRLHEAQTEESVAKTELNAAERRYKQSTGARQNAHTGVPILAPIDGVLAQVQGAPGKFVNEGDALFHIINLDKLWLEARIAEADIGRLQQPNGAWFTVEGFKENFSTFDLNGRLVSLGGIIDPVNRTTPLIFEIDNPDQRLRAGMFTNVRVFTGEASSGVSVPATAIYDDGGQEVVYVMLGGESFQRRVVQLGIRDAGQVLVTSGVQPGEWVVSRGAYLVRLASASPAEAGHGHAH